MTRIRALLSIWQHRLLCACSRAYRDLDAIRNDREKWRRDCVTAQMETEKLRKGTEEVHSRLQLSLVAQESAAQQLMTERALRQASDQRADRYHEELTDALKRAADWSTRAMNRRAMFSTDTGTGDDLQQQGTSNSLTAIRPKPMARQVAQQVTDATLKQMLEDIRSGKVIDEDQVGPEFGQA